MACDPRDKEWLIQEFRGAGYDAVSYQGPWHFGVRGIARIWRSLGLAEGKHIPAQYLRASLQQRLALAQGLIDSDGHLDGRGSFLFTNSNRQLIEDFAELLASLGCVARVTARGQRSRRGRISRPAWVVITSTELPLARLPRKMKMARSKWGREQSTRYITAVRPVPSVPVRCVAVDSLSHLFLVSKSCIPTHNSRAVDVAVAEMICSGTFVVFYADGQGGVSGPALTDHVDWFAGWHDEIVAMVMAAYRIMKARQKFFAGYQWTDEYGNPRTGTGWFPAGCGLPFLQVVLDEAQEPLRDIRVSKIIRELQRLGPKAGIGVLQATQITSVQDTGGASGDVGAQGNRAFAKAGGNVLMYRSGETLTGSSMLPPASPSTPGPFPWTPRGCVSCLTGNVPRS